MARLTAAFDRWWNSISLRTKITGVTVLLLTFGLTVAGAGTMTVLRGYLLEQVDTELREEFAGLPAVLTVDDIQSYSSSSGSYIAALTSDGEVIAENLAPVHAALRPDTSSLTSDRVAEITVPISLSNTAGTTEWRVHPAQLRAMADGQPVTLVIALSLRQTDALVARYTLIYFLFALAVVLFGAAATQLLVTSTFAPLRDVEATAARFASGDFSQRLGGATPNTEVGRLNRSLNAMLARIDRAFADRERAVEQMRRFVGDASHELRTPLVSVRGYAELYRMGALQRPEDVAQAMDRIEREAIRMGGLVEDLLQLARLDEARPLQLVPVALLPIAQDAALDASAASPERQVRVVVVDPPEPDQEPVAPGPAGDANRGKRTVWRSAAPRPADPARDRPEPATTTSAIARAALARLGRRRKPAAPDPVQEPTAPILDAAIGPTVLGEGDKIRQVVTNLLGNAMRFTPDDSPIEIEVGVDPVGGFGQIAIVDHGEGIPPSQREKIFQRFWRADTSRTRDTGGSGLGLAIVAGIVAGHHGYVEVLETPGGGATFRVSIPLAPTSPPSPSSPETGDDSEKDEDAA